MQRIWIGTSGWVYKHWAASFYPPELAKKNEFQFYATQFPTVEINATFYRLPTPNMVRGWRKKAPSGFLFAVKGSRFITHIKRLKATAVALNKYFRRIAPLQERLGPILWQLPPNFEKKLENEDRLQKFIKRLPREYCHAIEFRHPSWIEKSTFELLRSGNIAHCWLSSQRMPTDCTTTADFVYLRFHGLKGGAAHNYTESELKPWAEELRKAAKAGKDCYVYFNNDLNTRAPGNAMTLMKMVEPYVIKPFANADQVRQVERRRTTIVPVFAEPRSKRLAAATLPKRLER